MSFLDIPFDVISNVIFPFQALEDLYNMSIVSSQTQPYLTRRVVEMLKQKSHEPLVISDKYKDYKMLEFIVNKASLGVRGGLTLIIMRNKLPFIAGYVAEKYGFSALENSISSYRSKDEYETMAYMIARDDTLLRLAIKDGRYEWKVRIIYNSLREGTIKNLISNLALKTTLFEIIMGVLNRLYKESMLEWALPILAALQEDGFLNNLDPVVIPYHAQPLDILRMITNTKDKRQKIRAFIERIHNSYHGLSNYS